MRCALAGQVITEESTARHLPHNPGVLPEAYSLRGLPAQPRPKNFEQLFVKPRWLDTHTHTQLLVSGMNAVLAKRCSHYLSNSTLVDRAKVRCWMSASTPPAPFAPAH